MKYVVKRVFIGVILFLIIGFLKSINVFALSVGGNTSQYVDDFVSGTWLPCVLNDDNLTCGEPYDQNFNYGYNYVNPGNILKNLNFRFDNVYVDNQNDSSTYYVRLLDSSNNAFPFYFDTFEDLGNIPISRIYMKNFNIIGCTYFDINNEEQSCIDNIIQSSPSSFVYEDYTQHYGLNDVYFKVLPNGYYKDITIRFGGIGSPSGDINNLYSGLFTDSINTTYMDYDLINNITYSFTKTIKIGRPELIDIFYHQLVNVNNYTTSAPTLYTNYSNGVGITSQRIQLSNSLISSQVSQALTQEEIDKQQAINNQLIDYNAEQQQNNNTEFANNLKNTFGNLLGGGPVLFQSFLSLPIELLRENARNEILTPTVGGVGVVCSSYNSAYINDLTVSSELSFIMPFTHQQFNLNCKDVDVVNNIVGYFGTTYESQLIHTIYHTILTGLLSYWVVIAYFKFIKEVYDPDNNSIEVMDL